MKTRLGESSQGESTLDTETWISTVQYGIVMEDEVEPVADEPPVVEPKEEADAKPEAKPATPEPPPPATDWRDRRISQLTARLRDLERINKEATDKGSAPPAVTGPTQAELDKLINEQAQSIAAAREFDRQCNTVAERGREQFPDFNSRISALTGLVDTTSPRESEQYNQFLIAAIETGRAEALLHELGGNLNEASRILALPPARMGVELGKLAAKADAPKPPPARSEAPNPITPVGTRGGNNPIRADDPERADRLSTAEWMRRRSEDVAKQEVARRGGR